MLISASHVNALGVISHCLEKRESNATSSLMMCIVQPAKSRKLTKVHIVGQRYILKSRGMNCGAEIHVVEQKYILKSRAEVTIV